ncbi:MAG: SHOCT domain-containing protein [Candidatus Brocadiaceae bacterium]
MKIFIRAACIPIAVTFTGCTTVKYYPVNFVESLKHPTKFPESFSSNVQNVEELAEKNPLGEGETVKIIDVAENKNSSMHLIQIRENGELKPQYHKRHDEVIYVKKGSGIATLDGTRYMIKPGSMLQIPSKTVHKILNTGGEKFVAVSIFSPPFDGRDEKMIKEKKKFRDTKEEKRLATKKPEKITKDAQTSTTTKPPEEKAQSSEDKTGKVEERPSDVSDLDEQGEEKGTKIEKTAVSPKKYASLNGKKKPTGTPSAEEPVMNISELHEKLTKLMALKEEGALSEEEYEAKKDDLMKGKDIGVLPEPKGKPKEELAREDESYLHTAESDSREDVGSSRENSDAKSELSRLSTESKAAVPEVGSREEEKGFTHEDKLKTLEEMKEEHLITAEDYETKKKEILGLSENKVEEKLPEVADEDERLKELKELYKDGLITEEDYESKKKAIFGSAGEETASKPSKTAREDERIKELNELRDEGLITEDDYQYKLKGLAGGEKAGHYPSEEEIVKQKNEIDEKPLSLEETPKPVEEPNEEGLSPKTGEEEEPVVEKEPVSIPSESASEETSFLQEAEKGVPPEDVSGEREVTSEQTPEIPSEEEIVKQKNEIDEKSISLEEMPKPAEKLKEESLSTERGEREEPVIAKEEKTVPIPPESALNEDKELKELYNLLRDLQSEPQK